MSTQEKKNILPIVALAVFVITIFSTGVALFYIGSFSQVTLEKVKAPGYRLVYVNHIGPYNEIKNIFKEVEGRLKAANITPIAAATLFLDDSGQVEGDKLRSKVGYIIAYKEQSPSGLNEEKLLSQEVIQATFNGSPVVGSYKAYTAMRQWSADNHYHLNLPSLEIYYPDGLTVYQLPISLNTEKN